MTSHVCRIASLEDLEQLVALRAFMQKEVNNVSDSGIDADYLADVRRYFSRAMASGTYVSAVADAGGRLVAATGLVIYEKPPSLSGRNGRQGYVTNVYTSVDWRGKGVATELMRLTIDQARLRGVDKLHLGTREGAQRVYESVGFVPTRLPHLELSL